MPRTTKTNTRRTKPVKSPAVDAATKRRAAQIYKKLLAEYPDAKCALDHDNAWQLLVATILSAQCTDVRVNLVTPVLFKTYPTPAALAAAKPAEVEKLIKSTGFYRNKAKSIQGASRMVSEEYASQVPDAMDALLSLPGVARKTANVVLGNAFNKNEGVVVDTHVTRVSGRLGLTQATNAKKIEQDLMALFPRANWTMLAHLFIFHGRRLCVARSPICSQCPVNRICPKIGVVKSR